MVEIRKISREEVEKASGRKSGKWTEKVDREKLLLLLDEILATVEENTETAVEFDGKEFLAELGINVSKLKSTTINSKVNEVIRKVGTEIRKWDRQRYKLVTRIDDENKTVKCFVMIKKKVLNE